MVLLHRCEDLSALDPEMQDLMQPNVYIRKYVTMNIVLVSGFILFMLITICPKKLWQGQAWYLNL